MRFRPARSVLLAAVALSWAACQDTAQQDSPPAFEPSFAARGPADKACDTKDLPVRDYFLSRADATLVKEQLRDLTAACNDGLGAGDSVLQIGFAILTGVENARNNENAGAPLAGAQIVVGVWNVMTWDNGAFFACVNCTIPVLKDKEAQIGRALDADGGFGVRGPEESTPVVSTGDPVWGIEPDATCGGSVCDWGDVLPFANGARSSALIFGYLGIETTLILGNETPLPGTDYGFDWSVAPWHANTTTIVNPLAVGVCSEPLTAGNQKRISHGSSILQLASPPSYCPPPPSGLLKLASAIVPMWPQPLYAALAGVSGSGKARDFSLFNGYGIPPDGVITFLTQPGDANAYTSEGPVAGDFICNREDPVSSDGSSCDDGIRVSLTTLAGSRLIGHEVTLVLTPKDNNGSWTLFGDPVGTRVDTGPEGPLVYEWTDLALDKPGGYRLCVTSEGSNTTGLDFPETCSEAFHINF